MEWQKALVIVVERTKHARYRELCADGHPDHEAWRRVVIRRATGLPPAPPPAPDPDLLPSIEEADRIIAELERAMRGQPTRGRCCG